MWRGVLVLTLAAHISAIAQSASAQLTEVHRLLDAGKLAEARQLLDTVPGTAAGVTHLRGLIAYKLHDYPGAIAAFREAASREARGSTEIRESWLLLGQSYFLSGRVDDAMTALEKAVEAGVHSNEAFYMLGVGYIKLRRA